MYLSSGAFGKYHRGNKPSNIDKKYISAKNRCFDIAFVRNHVKSQNVQGPLQGWGPEGGGVRKPWKTKLSLPLPENLDLLMHYIWFLKMCLDPPPPPLTRNKIISPRKTLVVEPTSLSKPIR